MVSQLKPVTASPPDELKKVADRMRELADDIERGDVVGVAWVEIIRGDQFRADTVKAKGVTTLEMLGGATFLSAMLVDNLKD